MPQNFAPPSVLPILSVDKKGRGNLHWNPVLPNHIAGLKSQIMHFLGTNKYFWKYVRQKKGWGRKVVLFPKMTVKTFLHTRNEIGDFENGVYLRRQNWYLSVIRVKVTQMCETTFPPILFVCMVRTASNRGFASCNRGFASCNFRMHTGEYLTYKFVIDKMLLTISDKKMASSIPVIGKITICFVPRFTNFPGIIT